MSWFRRVQPFIMATHFRQAAAMVTLMTLGSALLGQRGWVLFLVFAAAASGQAAVGWTNDLIDAKVDQSLNRTNKPVVKNSFQVDKLRKPILVALVLTVPLSIAAAGWVGGGAHLFAVAQGLIYDRFAARRTWSWVPYALAFASLPVFVFQSVSLQNWPGWQLTLACSLIGVVAHLLNALPDIELDRKAGLGGFAVYLGAKRVWWVLVVMSVLAIWMLVLALQV